MNISMNKWTGIGNLGNDAVCNYTANNTPVANFSMATNENIPNGMKDGKKTYRKHTEWHNVVVWGPLAEKVQKFAKKGDCVMVEGSLRTRIFKNGDGVEVKRTEIKAGKVTRISQKTTEALPELPSEEEIVSAETWTE